MESLKKYGLTFSWSNKGFILTSIVLYVYLNQSYLWQNIWKYVNDPTYNTSIACLQGKQQNINALRISIAKLVINSFAMTQDITLLIMEKYIIILANPEFYAGSVYSYRLRRSGVTWILALSLNLKLLRITYFHLVWWIVT